MPPKNTLGRGLGAIFPDLLVDDDSRSSFVMCGIEELTPNRFQPRKEFRDEDQKQLVASVKKNGIIQPIIVRKAAQGYEIIAGERRWRAAQEAGLKEVPVILRKAKDVELAELSLIENIQREALNPLEEAEAYQTLIGDFGLSQEEVSARVGKDRSTVANSVRLLKLPAAIKTALVRKEISSGHARALLSLAIHEEQNRVFNVIIKKSLSVRQTERLVQDTKKPAPPVKKIKKEIHIADLESKLSSLLMAKVQLKQGRKGGSIEIRFTSNEDLGRLVDLLFGIEKD
ncbi:MAG: ParB/RepB/Spo0J family partition protein [Smithellaceae bacterium]|nr:ParB/RepB/Spo0J family partition protein [Smithellaceae bacterium]